MVIDGYKRWFRKINNQRMPDALPEYPQARESARDSPLIPELVRDMESYYWTDDDTSIS